MADLELNSIGNGDGTNYLVRDNTKIPLSGTSALAGSIVPSTDNTYDLGSSSKRFTNIYTCALRNPITTSGLYLGYENNAGSRINFFGKDAAGYNGWTSIISQDSINTTQLLLKPDGTLSWSGSAIQYVSDKRLKQQISQIDDDLLTAWEDVNPVQFKYNDAVEEKGNTARLHTGYVVQQIDEACKKHNVDVSKYGLYCHEEYKEETREVEHDDGTKTVEVVRPASEHYSLRYTEALIVECAYLRKKNKDLQEQLNALSERLEKLENR